MKKVLAIASAGGHWKQLMLLTDAFNNSDVMYITTLHGLPEQNGIINYEIVNDCNKEDKISVMCSFIRILFVFLKFRPDVIISTGAAPGVLGIIVGRIFNKKTIWIDSIANAEELSLGGKISKRFANVVLTQWDSLKTEGVDYKGSVF